MGFKTTWLEGAKGWFDDLLEGDERFYRGARWTFFALIVVALGWGGFCFVALWRGAHMAESERTVRPLDLSRDRERLEALALNYDSVQAERKDSLRLANDIIRIGRNPMVRMEAPKNVPVASTEPSVEDLVDLPPLVIVRAVMVMGKDASAVVDIDGIGNGMVVRKGTTFADKKGRFLAIGTDKLIFRWNGTNVSVPVNL
ncbi:hypothetical protein L2W58_01040 [Dethiosulfovibrio sp. F2B]|uniref:hypothetical protein n=1 Tax=Dethiosulfovibrio faecalis TaxID=2720018 RepID=UPI001F200264|nr:hypothetical protein [Dethiosulfovibrio faecalis]MCF4150391.1 hypothetical protein [Dethiosulfovibrio faecalis]